MRVYCIGAHSTGKSTLLKKLKEKYSKINIREGISRIMTECQKETGMDDYTRQLITNKIAIQNWKNNEVVPNLFSTRSILDSLVYCKLSGFNNLVNDYINNLNNGIDLNSDDIIWLYFPIEFPIEDDGVRNISIEFQKDVDQLLYSYATQYINKRIYTITGPIENRIKTLEYILTIKGINLENLK